MTWSGRVVVRLLVATALVMAPSTSSHHPVPERESGEATLFVGITLPAVAPANPERTGVHLLDRRDAPARHQAAAPPRAFSTSAALRGSTRPTHRLAGTRSVMARVRCWRAPPSLRT